MYSRIKEEKKGVNGNRVVERGYTSSLGKRRHDHHENKKNENQNKENDFHRR